MSIQASAAASAGSPVFQSPIAPPPAKSSVTAPVAKNDADGDLQKDLATGENPYPSVGSNVNVKA